ncbi:isochorismate synthase [Fervidibacillus halotolerans]|uniref:isochorismate synthase n=1 Tax=Fervidibacillus halotolerans TaxID=2980027 RepID=A0A9E8LYA7_9BACI|nr:isochorismate synthase [Fervidibacillus halotolerans]WAA11796.1 isochorismate synthase [Fervidibacillus halotolerans]
MMDVDSFDDFQHTIQEGRKKAKEFNRAILVSVVEKIQNIDPLLFLRKNIESVAKETFYWENSSGNFQLAGVGSEKIIRVNPHPNRFEHVQNQWSEILDQAVIDNPTNVKGTGPLLFGSFSFLPNMKVENSLWENFKSGLFYLPKFLVTKNDKGTYLTTNVFCFPDKPCQITRLRKERDQLFFHNEEKLTPLTFDQPIIKNENDEKWIENVGKAVQLLKENYIKKVVLARELRLTFQKERPFLYVLNQLIKQQNNNYIFSISHNGDHFLGATPERLVRKEGNRIFSACVAGSAPTGKTFQEKEEMKRDLLQDKKNLGEHAFVVEMINSVFQQYCDHVKKLNQPEIMENRDILHLYTPVEGVLSKENTSIFEIVEKLHPTPAMGGVPLGKAISLIQELELFERGLYASPIGWVDHESNGEFVVAIRSGLLKGTEASIFAGCGIVKDSDPLKEYEETNIKFRPMLRALGGIDVESPK